MKTSVIIAAALLSITAVRADKQVSSAPFNLPVQVNAIVDETGCRNHPGPTITMSGELMLGEVNVRLTFSNNRKGTHQTVVLAQYDVTLLVEGSAIEIPKQPVQGGVGGNPLIYLQFHDGEGKDLGNEVLLGRCVRGLKVSTDLLIEALAHANVHAEGCSNRGGPFITLDGNLVVGGLHARFIFRNNVKGRHTAEDSRDVAIILSGTEIVLPKQPSRGGVGGNPIISLQFLDGKKQPLGPATVLGRCTQL
jgi:hypothetical protein